MRCLAQPPWAEAERIERDASRHASLTLSRSPPPLAAFLLARTAAYRVIASHNTSYGSIDRISCLLYFTSGMPACMYAATEYYDEVMIFKHFRVLAFIIDFPTTASLSRQEAT